MNRSALVVGLVSASLMIPGVASAGTVTVVGSNPFASFEAGAGEVNDLRAEGFPMTITDAGAALTPKKGCAAAGGGVRCDGIDSTRGATGRPGRPRLRLPLGPEQAVGRRGRRRPDTPTPSALPARPTARAGNDTITAYGEGGQIADGGSGDDTINSARLLGRLDRHRRLRERRHPPLHPAGRRRHHPGRHR